MRNIPFSPPDITQAEIDEVVDTLKSGWITTGPKTKHFERELAEYSNAAGCACLASCTAALECTLRLLGIGAGDEVITTAYTYTASASVIAHVGAKIVLCDTAKDSFFMDYTQLERLINERTKAIICVDIAGKPCDYNRIFSIVSAKKSLFTPSGELQGGLGRIAVIADAAHSLGAEYMNKPVGGIADFTCFSFHVVKNLTTAEGGAALWRQSDAFSSDSLYSAYMLQSLHGQNKDALAKTAAGKWEYDILAPLYKCNMTDIMASLGLAQLSRYKLLLQKRRELISIYDAAFMQDGFSPLVHFEDEFCSSGHLYLLRIDGMSEEKRNLIIEEAAKRGISCNVHYKPLPMLTAYKNLGFSIADFPNAFAQYKNEISLPLNTKMTADDADYTAQTLTELIKSCC